MAKPKKKIASFVKLQVKAGQANPSPPVGTALGPTGVNIKQFCDAFNEQTKDNMGMPLPVEITVYADRTFDFKVKTPPAAVLLLKAAGLEKGSSTPNTEKVGKVTRAQLEDIVNTKMVDLSAHDMEAGVKIIAGTARSMGIEVEGI